MQTSDSPSQCCTGAVWASRADRRLPPELTLSQEALRLSYIEVVELKIIQLVIPTILQELTGCSVVEAGPKPTGFGLCRRRSMTATSDFEKVVEISARIRSEMRYAAFRELQTAKYSVSKLNNHGRSDNRR